MNFLKSVRILLCLLIPLYTTNSISQPGQPIAQPKQVTVPTGQMGAQPVQIMPGQIAPPTQNNLIIGVDGFTPPFVMQGGNGELYGYDISMINSLCAIIHRSCQFQVMKFIELLPAIMDNQIDLAVSSITITSERSKQIKFSLPYALSYSRFLTNSDTPVAKPFSLSSLNGKRIGVNKGTIYEDQASRIGVKAPIIQTYMGYHDALNALTNKEVDYILLDNPTALYWAANSAGGFKVIGEPYVYGFGIGIAISNKDVGLIPHLNNALLQYQNSEAYRQNYHRFLDFF